jgi:exportin-2 (importin alpha re-exporter)
MTFIIREISKNPSNPKFNHFAFETVSAVVRYVCQKQPELVDSFEQALFNTFQEILAHEVAEFTPYVYQILSQLLELHQQGVPDVYFVILQPLMTPLPWENHANIPALVNLLCSFLEKANTQLIQKGIFQSFLGIFQKLLSSKMNDHHGFTLLESIFEYTPVETLAPFVKNMFVVIMTRLFQSTTPKLERSFLKFLVFVFNLDRPGLQIDDIITSIDSINPQPLFGSLLQNILIKHFQSLQTLKEKKDTELAMIRLLCTMKMQSVHSQSWPLLLDSIIQMFQKVVLDEFIQDDLDLEESGYQPSFTKLSSVKKVLNKDVDPEVYLYVMLKQVLAKNPALEGVVRGLTCGEMLMVKIAQV